MSSDSEIDEQPRKYRSSKEDRIYGIFGAVDEDQGLSKDDRVLKMMSKQYPHLQLFQDEFSQQTPKVEAKSKGNSYQEYSRQQAFGNFRKSVTVEKSNTGVKVSFGIEKPKKKVTFNMGENTVHTFVKNKDEYLTPEQKLELNKRVYLYQIGVFHQDDDDEEESDQVNDDLEIHVSQKTTVAGILKRPHSHWKNAPKPQVEQKKPKKLIQTHKKKKQIAASPLFGGVGFEMLKKLGYTGGGLGKDEQGITEPVQAVKKSAFTGQGDILVEFEPEVEIVDTVIEKPMSKAMQKMDKMWKKTKQTLDKQHAAHQPKDQGILNLDRNAIVDNLIQGQQGIKSLSKNNTYKMNTTEIIDMTSKKVQGRQESIYLNGLQDIQWQIQSILEKNLSKLQKIEQNIKLEKDKQIMFKHDVSEKHEQYQKCTADIIRKEAFLNQLDKMDFHSLLNQFQEEFVELNLILLQVKILQQEITVSDWQGPVTETDLLQYEFNKVKNCISLIKDVFILKKSKSMKQYTSHLDVTILNSQISTSDVKLIKRYIGYIIGKILSKLRSYMVNHWDPLKQNYLLDFLKLWTQQVIIVETDDLSKYPICILDEQMKDIESIIKPRLLKQINEWEFKSDQGMEVWLMEWVTFLRDQQLQDCLWMRLSQTSWTIDAKAVKSLTPWRTMFGEKWDALILRSIIPKLLQQVMRTVINPADQDISGVQNILLWTDYIEDHLRIVYDRLIQKLRETFVLWLAQGGERKEMHIWLDGWMQFLRPIISRIGTYRDNFEEMRSLLVC